MALVGSGTAQFLEGTAAGFRQRFKNKRQLKKEERKRKFDEQQDKFRQNQLNIRQTERLEATEDRFTTGQSNIDKRSFLSQLNSSLFQKKQDDPVSYEARIGALAAQAERLGVGGDLIKSAPKFKPGLFASKSGGLTTNDRLFNKQSSLATTLNSQIFRLNNSIGAKAVVDDFGDIVRSFEPGELKKKQTQLRQKRARLRKVAEQLYKLHVQTSKRQKTTPTPKKEWMELYIDELNELQTVDQVDQGDPLGDLFKEVESKF